MTRPKFLYAERWAVVDSDAKLVDVYVSRHMAEHWRGLRDTIVRVKIVPWRKAESKGDGGE